MTLKKLIKPIALMANGRYPSNPYPIEIINNAKTIICTDGSANKLMKHGLQPTIIIGDMDSIKNINDFNESEFIHLPNQDNTDLEKVIEYCIKYGIKEVDLLGATGIRDDHSFANFLLLIKYQRQIKINLITDAYTIECIKGKRTFSTFPGQIVSIIALHRIKSVSTKGLKFSLKKQSLYPSGMGVSNVASGDRFSIRASGEILIFRKHN